MRIRRKIRSQSGLTLAETLVATIILLLVSTIVVQGIPVAKNAYEKVVVAANAKVMLTTAITALRNELSTAQRIELTSADDKSITYYSADRGATSKIYLSDGTDINYPAGTVMLQEYQDYGDANADDTGFFEILNPDWEPKLEVSAKARALVTSLEAQRGRPDSLYISYEGIVYDKTTKVITVKDLKVCRSSDNATLAQFEFGESASDHVLKIRVIPNEAKFFGSQATTADTSEEGS